MDGPRGSARERSKAALEKGREQERCALAIVYSAQPPRRVNEIVLGKRSITADTALRLAHYFGTSEQFWMALQASYDLEEARITLGPRLKQLQRAAA